MVRIAVLSLSLLAAAAVGAEPFPPTAIGFVPNLGQFDTRVAFQAELPDRNVFVVRDGALVQQFRADNGRAWTLVEHWSGDGGEWQSAGAAISPVAWIGTGATRQSTIHARVRRDAVWPGVNAELRLRDGGVESQFDLAAGVDADVIAVRLDGAKRLILDRAGGMRIGIDAGELRLSAPIAWQMIDGVRADVPVRFVLRGSDGYGFDVGAHDARHTLHIDPVLRSTFVGGNSDDSISDLAVADDSVYASGFTTSANFPGTTGGFQPTIIRNSPSSGNAFVARYSCDLTQLLQATYFGAANSGALQIQQIAISADSVYLVGQTGDGNLPAGQSPGAQASAPSGAAAFVARLNRELTLLRASSYHGGSSGFTNGNGIALSADSVYIAGNSTSPDLPNSSGAAVPTLLGAGGANDAFVARFSLDLGTRLRSSYVSGANSVATQARDVLVDADGVYVGGETQGQGLLATSGAFQPNRGGTTQRDGFIARFSHDLTTLHRSTYLGGGHDERVWRMAANASAIYAVGDVNAASSNFPIAPNAPDSTFANWEGYVFAISRDLSTRIGATLIGGNNADGVSGIVAEDSRVFVAGVTLSSNLPGAAGGAESQNPSQQSVGFVTQFDPALSEIRQSSYYGVDTGAKQVTALAATGSDVYLAGGMAGGTLPNSAGAAQPLHGGGPSEGFIGLFSADLQPPQPSSDLAISKTGSPDLEYNQYLIYTIEVRNLGPDAVTGAPVTDLLPGAQLVAANWSCSASVGAACNATSGSGSISATVNLPVNGLATFTLCARYEGAGADVANTAAVAVPANHVDPNLANNAATYTVVDPSLFKDGFEDHLPPPLCAGL